MTFKRALYASALTAGVGLAGLLGVGLGTAGADPQCNAPNRPPCGQNQQWNNGPGDSHWQDNNGRGNDNWQDNDNGRGNDNWQDNDNGPVDWHNRGFDQGRQDHQPFNWNGQQVNPIQAGNGAGWGFWFMGMWIPI